MRNLENYEKDYNCFNISNWNDPVDVYNAFYRYLALTYIDATFNVLNDYDYYILNKDKFIYKLYTLKFWDYCDRNIIIKKVSSVLDLNDQNILMFLKQLIVLFSNDDKYYNDNQLFNIDLDLLYTSAWRENKILVKVMRLAFNDLKKNVKLVCYGDPKTKQWKKLKND